MIGITTHIAQTGDFFDYSCDSRIFAFETSQRVWNIRINTQIVPIANTEVENVKRRVSVAMVVGISFQSYMSGIVDMDKYLMFEVWQRDDAIAGFQSLLWRNGDRIIHEWFKFEKVDRLLFISTFYKQRTRWNPTSCTLKAFMDSKQSVQSLWPCAVGKGANSCPHKSVFVTVR